MRLISDVLNLFTSFPSTRRRSRRGEKKREGLLISHSLFCVSLYFKPHGNSTSPTFELNAIRNTNVHLPYLVYWKTLDYYSSTVLSHTENKLYISVVM